MVEVRRMFATMVCTTEVWASDEAADAIMEQLDRSGADKFGLKLQDFAKHGFAHAEKIKAVRRRKNSKVYRIGQTWTQFRLLGFYQGRGKVKFIVILGYTKKGRRRDNHVTAKVEAIRENRQWMEVR